MSQYLIGIDLGTTNSAVAYIDLRRKPRPGSPEIQTFAVPQLVAPAEVKERPLLPSFLYIPGAHDLPPGSTALPWDPQRGFAVGEFARNHGSRIPGRLVTSAKSWLCHAGVDRTAALLPWSAPPDVPRISPVEASARYLTQMVEGWNHLMAKDRPEHRMEKQAVVLTVPASFDDVARNLTVEAARKAGLENVTLLEEPQAAFYCWLAVHSVAEAGALKPGSLCLVIDVGGGTTDFSLIQAVEQQGELGFVRQAVGDHLLLGGDNMDLALAKFVETKLPAAGRLDAVQYGMLTQACRLAKETLLVPTPPASHTVTVMGRGRAVVGGTLHTALAPTDIRKLIFDGFFPQVARDAEPGRGARSGLHEMGLPYVNDPGVTRHLAAFLKKQAGTQAPHAILFNGGVFQPAVLRDRVIDVMRQWYSTPAQPWQPLVLSNPSLDLAVAWGAAHYAWLRHSGGKRIGGGIARSYYVAIETGETQRDGQMMDVLCIVPQHLEEGHAVTLEKPELELALGQPVVFPLYTSTVRGDDQAGALLKVSSDQLLHLPPLQTILRGGKRSGTKNVPVSLAAYCTEIGTLEVFCVARDGGNRWRLEFNIREIIKDEPQPAADVAGTTFTDVWPEELLQGAATAIRKTYQPANGDEIRPQDLTKAIEAALDSPRHNWPTGLCRRLWDFLAEVQEQRRKSPAHLNRWFHLVGYCLRPGFGDSLDRFRVEQLWKFVQTPPRTEPGKPVPRVLEGGADYWIMWRRVAGGLNPTLQNALLDRLRPSLLPGKAGKGGFKPQPNELAEMWRAAASLERVDAKNKDALAQVLLKQVRRSPVPTYAFWAITRLGARVPFYGPLNTIVHPQVVETWLDALAGFTPTHPSEKTSWAFCLAQMARKSGQRALDIDDSHRKTISNVVQPLDVPDKWKRMVDEVVEPEGEEQSEMFGESLPIGLRLARTSE
jgi:molecular chaperone DnaK (HSP70)